MTRYWMLVSILLLSACAENSTQNTAPNTASTEDSSIEKTEGLGVDNDKTIMSQRLSALKQRFLDNADKQKIDTYEAGIEEIRNSSIMEEIIKPGNRFPNFNLEQSNGEQITLEELLVKGPLVITWFRGNWCPYCNTELTTWQEYQSKLASRGSHMVAISPQIPDSSRVLKERLRLDFEILTDQNNQLAKYLKMNFKLSDDVMYYYNQSFDLSSYNGNQDNELPLAMTMIIDIEGFLRFASYDLDYRNRATPEEVLKALMEI